MHPGHGKPQTLLLRRLSIIRELLDQLPRVASFQQTLALSLVDGLAFQDRGFQVKPQYTFQIDCRESLEFKTRQHIRRANEKFAVTTLGDPTTFIGFYLDNMRRQAFVCAAWPQGKPAAMVVLVWGHGRMYLKSTRARDEGDNGSTNLLIWEGIERAHARGMLSTVYSDPSVMCQRATGAGDSRPSPIPWRTARSRQSGHRSGPAWGLCPTQFWIYGAPGRWHGSQHRGNITVVTEISPWGRRI